MGGLEFESTASGCGLPGPPATPKLAPPLQVRCATWKKDKVDGPGIIRSAKESCHTVTRRLTDTEPISQTNPHRKMKCFQKSATVFSYEPQVPSGRTIRRHGSTIERTTTTTTRVPIEGERPTTGQSTVALQITNCHPLSDVI